MASPITVTASRSATRFSRRPRSGRLWPWGPPRTFSLPLWLLAAALVTTRLYHQMPHILDAMSYTFQAGLFVSGRLALDAGPLAGAFRGPFEVLSNGRLFSQYPPGAPAAYALGQLVGLEWLVGPLACLALLAATRWTASVLFGRACGLAVLCLGVLSPFVLFQAGSFLSHPIAGGLLAGALAAFVAGDRDGKERWYALSGALLGAGFLTREASSVLFALPLAARLLATRRWRPLTWIVAAGMPFVLLYLLYNAQLTGSALVLPRTIFDAADHFGFGDGIGFHTRHTLAAGLANTDELLTLLQFDLFGWPPLFALGLLGLPFLFGRAPVGRAGCRRRPGLRGRVRRVLLSRHRPRPAVLLRGHAVVAAPGRARRPGPGSAGAEPRGRCGRARRPQSEHAAVLPAV